MLTSFFGKSAPLNFLLLCGYIFVLFLLRFVLASTMVLNGASISSFAGVALLLLFSVLLLDFTIRKNGLTKLNTYAIFLFSCASAMLSGIITDPWMVLSNVFILLALRRIFSLQNEKNNERKILDATIWILLASGVYFWNILLFVPLYLALTLKAQKEFRYYLIPFVGASALFLIATAFHFLLEDSFRWFLDWPDAISFSFAAYSTVQTIVFISFLLAMILWTLIPKFRMISKGAKKDKPNQILEIVVLFSLLISIVISSEKTGEELLFLIAPAAIIITGYMEKASERWFKELLLWSFLLLPILFFFF